VTVLRAKAWIVIQALVASLMGDVLIRKSFFAEIALLAIRAGRVMELNAIPRDARERVVV